MTLGSDLGHLGIPTNATTSSIPGRLKWGFYHWKGGKHQGMWTWKAGRLEGWKACKDLNPWFHHAASVLGHLLCSNPCTD